MKILAYLEEGQQQEVFLALLLFVLSIGIAVAAKLPWQMPVNALGGAFALSLFASGMLVFQRSCWRKLQNG